MVKKSKPKECILHIGSAKTGSSALQKLLYDFREQLAGKGCLYPTTGLGQWDRSHNGLGNYFWKSFRRSQGEQTFQQTLDKLMSEIEGWNNIIISSELMERIPIKGNANFSAFLNALVKRGYHFKVVYVVRRQDHYVDSQFKQEIADVHANFGGTASQFIVHCSKTLEYARTASLWRKLPGVKKLTVLPYLEGKARETFAGLLKAFEHPELLGPEMDLPMVNPSLDGLDLKLRHYLNSTGFSSDSDRSTKYFGSIRKGRRITDRLTLFTDESRKLFLSRFEQDLAELNAEYHLGMEAWHAEPAPARTLFQPLADDEISDAIVRVSETNPLLAKEILLHVNRLHCQGATAA